MTMFEEMAKELGVKITRDDCCMCTGMSKALKNIADDILCSDDKEVRALSLNEMEELIKEKFYKAFPYMKKA